MFSRSVDTESLSTRGELLDKEHPFRRDCAQAIGLLNPAEPPRSLIDALGSTIGKLADVQHTEMLVVLGPRGNGVYQAYETLRAERKPLFALKLEGVPGGLEPLGSLRLALIRRWGSPHAVREAVEAIDLEAADALEAVAVGDPPPRHSVVDALAMVTQHVCALGSKPWIYLDPLATIDVATLEVIRKALKRRDCEALFVARSSVKALPAELDGMVDPHYFLVPPVSKTSASAAMVDQPIDSALVRNVSKRCGTTLVTVAETLRALISNAEVVYEGNEFRWRQSLSQSDVPTGRPSAIETRLAVLQHDAMKFLQLACTATAANGLNPLLAAATHDGANLEESAAAFEQLRVEQFLTEDARCISEPMRRVVMDSMSRRRRDEVYRIVGAAIRDVERYGGPAVGATVGYYLCEGGEVERGSDALVHAGALAATLGYKRAAFKLAAMAVQFNPSEATRAAVENIGVDSKTIPPPLPAQEEEREETGTNPLPQAPDLPTSIVVAMSTADHVHIDRLIEEAITRGANLVSAECLRAISLVVRGELHSAGNAIEQAERQADMARNGQAKIQLVRAHLSVAKRRLPDAICESLDALAFSKDAGDAQGVVAAQHMLACVYTELDLPEIASTLL